MQADFSSAHDASPVHLVRHALEDRFAEFLWVPGSRSGHTALACHVLATFLSRAPAVSGATPPTELLEKFRRVAHEARRLAHRLASVAANGHLCSVLALVSSDNLHALQLSNGPDAFFFP